MRNLSLIHYQILPKVEYSHYFIVLKNHNTVNQLNQANFICREFKVLRESKRLNHTM